MSASGGEIPPNTVPQQTAIAVQQPTQQQLQVQQMSQPVQHTQHPHMVMAPRPQMDAAALLMANPHTAAVVATVAAAAAQHMAQAQQNQHGSTATSVVPQHAIQVAPHNHTIQAPAVVHQHPPSSAQHPAPAPAITVAAPQGALPPHLAAIFGFVPQYAHTAPAPPPPTAAPAMPQNTLSAANMAVQQAHNSGAVTNAMIANMQSWKLDQLEAHAKHLRDSGQPVPQAVAMLLADARRKEEKRTAKRVANRKSACTSRARKKALVEEMTRTNARLKRQALILALLPDLVIAITVDGEITFCSAQVERVLRHKIDNLIGANLAQLLLPESREAMSTLIQELVAAEKAAKEVITSSQVHAASRTDQVNPAQAQAPVAPNARGENGNGSASGVSSNGAAVVSEQSFPMHVVNVESQQANSGEENSDLSTGNTEKKITEGKKVTNNKANKPSQEPRGKEPKNGIPTHKGKGEKQSSSDESLSSSSDAKNLNKANENLNRNVRWHNKKLQSKSKSVVKGPKDDVTGASVTENNRHARLSSLKHVPDHKNDTEDHSSSSSSDSLLAGVEESKKKKISRRKNGNSSDDSGYRESNESAREDASSSSSDTGSAPSNTPGVGRRPKPLAPTCNICLIRNDLTTIWCEVTSSIRTRSMLEETSESMAIPSVKKAPENFENKKPSPEVVNKTEVKELLLCLRPIRDGDERVAESLRFGVGNARRDGANLRPTHNRASANGMENEATEKRVPMKKRTIVHQDAATAKVSNSSSSYEETLVHAQKKAKKSTGEAEKSVVESLMCLSNNK